MGLTSSTTVIEKDGSVKKRPPLLSMRFQKITKPDEFFFIKIDNAVRVPSMDLVSESDPFVRVKTSKGKLITQTTHLRNNTNPIWNHICDLTNRFQSLDEEIHFEVCDRDTFKASDVVGVAKITIRDLIKRPKVCLLVGKPNGDFVIFKRKVYLPTELHVSVVQVPKSYPKPIASRFASEEEEESEEMKKFAKHVMIITRGTRGDVQPYLALARGLANIKNYCVTICTELKYKDFVLKNAQGLSQGAIRYRPSGGDTHLRIDKPIARWAMAHPSEIMQIAMLARTEREFFNSEPVIWYWANKLKPQALIYGFTMVSIAMIISEKLQIPCCGFILQPTTIPSTQYPPVSSIDSHFVGYVDRKESKIATHDYNLWLKNYWDNDPIYRPLDNMRLRRGLKPFRGSNKSETISVLLDQKAPLVVPIHPVPFGGRPKDWPESVIMTDFIFLQGGATPKLSKEILDFIDAGHKANDPIIAMTFSSMPVSRTDILNNTFKILKECKSHPRVIALSGAKVRDKITPALTAQLEEFKKSGKILELEGAPFGLLFEKLDAVLIHGGLGTTAEALRAAIPTSVVGVLLMDQRFWGMMCEKLGVGDQMCHIKYFKDRCVEMVDNMLKEGSPMRAKAKEIAKEIQPTSPDGVPENVEAIVAALNNAKPIDTSALLYTQSMQSMGSSNGLKKKSTKTMFFKKKTQGKGLASRSSTEEVLVASSLDGGGGNGGNGGGNSRNFPSESVNSVNTDYVHVEVMDEDKINDLGLMQGKFDKQRSQGSFTLKSSVRASMKLLGIGLQEQKIPHDNRGSTDNRGSMMDDDTAIGSEGGVDDEVLT